MTDILTTCNDMHLLIHNTLHIRDTTEVWPPLIIYSISAACLRFTKNMRNAVPQGCDLNCHPPDFSPVDDHHQPTRSCESLDILKCYWFLFLAIRLANSADSAMASSNP